MRKLFLLGLFLFTATVSQAQWNRMRMQKEPAENYELKAGPVTMVIDAANGARIMSLKYDTVEVISQNPAPNMYGSTFWTSPQKEWNWPPVREHDMGRYTVEQKDGKIIMTSQVPERIPLRFRKTFEVDKKKKAFVITYTITNEGKEDRRVAPWEVTRVPGKGTVSFEAPVDSVWPAGLMDFKQIARKKGKPVASFEIDSKEQQRKTNANGTGWLTYTCNGLVLKKEFPDLKAGQAAPGEDEIQLYVHQGALYCELEEQGAYTLLHPGESLDWTVKWTLEKE